ncbi:DNA-directed RNA polymerases I, II, and III subunit RPABC5 [Pancytospora philotis]|nr:DNA-directed RNA polymerases I, II, and III subunit RPABC5 [Pancytospora philotis]
MIIPVRCFTCNKEISSRFSTYCDKRAHGISAKAALDELGMTRICCRRMYLGHVEIADQLLEYEKTESPEAQ